MARTVVDPAMMAEAHFPGRMEHPPTFDLPPTPRPDSSGIVVHMGSARGACSLGSDSARAPFVFTSGLSFADNLAQAPSLAVLKHDTKNGFDRCLRHDQNLVSQVTTFTLHCEATIK